MNSIIRLLAPIVSTVTAGADIQQQYAIQIAAALSGCRREHVAADFTPYDQRALVTYDTDLRAVRPQQPRAGNYSRGDQYFWNSLMVTLAITRA